MQGIGGVLRERREALGATLAEAEVATRIRQKYLAALESDEWQLLPGEVVGRGFLRNYATYLGLEPTEIIERRRAIADPSLSYLLADTSAGSNLPPVRQVDYRPKEVDLRDEPDVMETRELRVGPIVATLAVLSLAALLWFGRDTLSEAATGVVNTVQTSAARLIAAPTPTVAATVDGGIVNPQNLGEASVAGEGAASSVTEATESEETVSAALENQAAASVAQEIPSNSPPDGASADATSGNAPSTGALAALIPTATPLPQDGVATATADEAAAEAAAEVVEEPTPSPTPEPTATPLPPEPSPTPTEEPTPEPVVVPPSCPDVRSLIVSPGVGQIVSGAVNVTGTATHEAFGYYKLEFAPGANAAGGFVYFAGAQSAVNGGLLGVLNTAALGNGNYTIQLTVVDQTGNFPPPCQVTIDVQN
jgi:transcriptional regulator with XRE-family HTH domain